MTSLTNYVPSLSEFHRIVADYETKTDSDGNLVVDMSKFHSINIGTSFKVFPNTNTAAKTTPISVQYIEITITDRANGKTYLSKVNLKHTDNVRSKGLKSFEEREKKIANADPSLLFFKDENPIFYEALDNYYFQIDAIYNDYIEKGIFVDKAIAKKNPAKYTHSLQVAKATLSNNPVTEASIDGKELHFYRLPLSRNKDNKDVFTNPPRDSSKLVRDASGKFINFAVCSYEGKEINNYNIHNIINTGTIHFGELDLSSMSASSMGLSAKAKFSKNKHFIVFTPKKSYEDVSNMVNDDELKALERINAVNTAKSTLAVTNANASGSEAVYDVDEAGEDVEVDVGTLDLDL